MTDNLETMTSYDWSTDQEVLDVVAEILAKLPALQAKGAIDVVLHSFSRSRAVSEPYGF